MTKIRRVARKIEPTAAYYVEEQLWPVLIGLVVLGGFLIGVSLAYLPLSGVAWYQTAWPSVVVIPLIIAVAMALMARVDNRLFRRSLQLSLVLCAILHVAIIVQMLQTQLVSAVHQKEHDELAVAPPRQRKIVPEYHPTQLVPEEDRPRQDFEKPVETQSPLPTPEPEQIVRQPTEQERSPAQPQPIPVPEQQATTEPNVVSRNVPNEAAPRLAASTSRLSRQLQSSKARTSDSVDLPAIVETAAAAREFAPSTGQIERQPSESAVVTQRRIEPAAKAIVREAEASRRTNNESPTSEKATAAMPQRALAKSVETKTAQISAVEPPKTPRSQTSDMAARQTTIAQKNAGQPAVERRIEVQNAAENASVASPKSQVAKTQSADSPITESIHAVASPDRRAIAAAPAKSSSVSIPNATPIRVSSSEHTPEPSRLAMNRGQTGTVGGRASLNLDTSLSGATSPALTASSAARRAEATQRGPAGDALSPSAVSRIARSRSGADLPAASVRAEQLETATMPGAARVSEVTASSGAGLTRADAAARHDAVTGAKGLGEIDFGPTQTIAEAGSGRIAGGGQPELSLQAKVAKLPRKSAATLAEALATDVTAIGRVGASDSPVVAPSIPAELSAASTEAGRMNRVENAIGDRLTARTGAPGNEAAGLIRVELGAGPERAAVNPATLGSPDGTQSAPTTVAGPTRATLAGPTLREANVADIPEVGPRSAVAQAEMDHAASGAGRASMARSRSEALAVDIVAPTGPGGLGVDYSPEVGISSRQGREESVDVQLRSSRFVRTNVGGLPAVSVAAVIPTDAYSGRSARVRGEERAGGSGSASPQTEEAIERGLAFLSRNQGSNGAWSLQGFPEGAGLASDTAATALAVLAFQGAGYNHLEFQYRNVVRAGLTNLLKSQKVNGDLFVALDDESNKSVWLYSHSLAAIAICEAYGMTQDPALREPAQKSIDFIITGQHTERGGWRYAPGVGTDTSVTGWMMMALKSGELAGLEVPPETYRKISHWLDGAQQSRSEPHLYRYNPLAPDTPEQRHGRVTSKTMTAVGLLMRLYTGWDRDNPNMVRGAAYLADNPPAVGTPREPQRDTYYWYYATQVMAHVGGENWQAWQSQLHPLLVSSQITQGPYGGSWDPKAPIADRWGPHAGRIYITTMNLLSLEVQYRKLPLYGERVSGR